MTIKELRLGGTGEKVVKALDYLYFQAGIIDKDGSFRDPKSGRTSTLGAPFNATNISFITGWELLHNAAKMVVPPERQEEYNNTFGSQNFDERNQKNKKRAGIIDEGLKKLGDNTKELQLSIRYDDEAQTGSVSITEPYVPGKSAEFDIEREKVRRRKEYEAGQKHTLGFFNEITEPTNFTGRLEDDGFTKHQLIKVDDPVKGTRTVTFSFSKK